MIRQEKHPAVIITGCPGELSKGLFGLCLGVVKGLSCLFNDLVFTQARLIGFIRCPKRFQDILERILACPGERVYGINRFQEILFLNIHNVLDALTDPVGEIFACGDKLIDRVNNPDALLNNLEIFPGQLELAFDDLRGRLGGALGLDIFIVQIGLTMNAPGRIVVVFFLLVKRREPLRDKIPGSLGKHLFILGRDLKIFPVFFYAAQPAHHLGGPRLLVIFMPVAPDSLPVLENGHLILVIGDVDRQRRLQHLDRSV